MSKLEKILQKFHEEFGQRYLQDNEHDNLKKFITTSITSCLKEQREEMVRRLEGKIRVIDGGFIAIYHNQGLREAIDEIKNI